MRSALYEGSVRHRRREPGSEFRYPLFMMYLDLDELPWLFDCSRLFSARGPAPAWFRRADHLGDPSRPLATEVRELVGERGVVGADGPVRLLTNLRYLGHCFNPVSFYYCFAPDGERLLAAVAHVTNTPWGETHSYVFDLTGAGDGAGARVLGASARKQLHVSPLMGMDQRYDVRLTAPGERLAVHIESLARDGGSTFDATLALRRKEIGAGELRRALARYPLLTLRIVARIYGSALRLRARGARYHPHPRRAEASA